MWFFPESVKYSLFWARLRRMDHGWAMTFAILPDMNDAGLGTFPFLFIFWHVAMNMILYPITGKKFGFVVNLCWTNYVSYIQRRLEVVSDVFKFWIINKFQYMSNLVQQ